MLKPTDNQKVAEIKLKVPKSLSTHDLYILIINGEFIELTFYLSLCFFWSFFFNVLPLQNS